MELSAIEKERKACAEIIDQLEQIFLRIAGEEPDDSRKRQFLVRAADMRDAAADIRARGDMP